VCIARSLKERGTPEEGEVPNWEEIILVALPGPKWSDHGQPETIVNALSVSCLLKITGPNLFGPYYFSVSSLIIKQCGRLFSA
jgi:hypothetical protein